ncbi:hypothetical protein CONPUDRAFT_82780, partial [Coniophora puteana RWD-64-598 SS2]
MSTTAALCVHSLIETRQCRSRRHLAFLLAYVGTLWAAGTVLIGGISAVWVDMFVYHASSALASPQAQTPAPGGASAVGNTAYWVILMLTDGMMIWRFKVVWFNSRFYRYLVSVPILCYLGILIPGFFVFVIFSNHPIWAGNIVNEDLITAIFSSSFCLNIYVTALIAGRLFLYRRRFKANWGSPDTMHYTSMGSMLIESYLPLTVFTILFFVTYLLNNPARYMTTSVLGQMQITAPLMVMLRVSRGIAWDSSTTPRSIEVAIDRALQVHEERAVQVVPD